MPIYEYKCDSCGAETELQQSMKDDPLKECPECDNPVRRVFHPAGLIFKGSGFHITDYVKPEQDSKRKKAKAESDRTRSGNDSTSDKPKEVPKAAAKEGAKESTAVSTNKGSASEKSSGGGTNSSSTGSKAKD